MPDTLSRRPPRRFWGWGQADAALDSREQSNLRFMLDQLGAVQCEAAPPRVEDFALRAPRIGPPAARPNTLSSVFSTPMGRLSSAQTTTDAARITVAALRTNSSLWRHMWMRRPCQAGTR